MTTIKLKNGSGAPTAGDLVQGEPALDLTNKRLYTEDSGGAVIEVGTNPTSVTTGAITADTISLGDYTDALTLGASNDLSLYHDGTNSQIKSDTGSLILRTDAFRVLNNANSEQILHGDANGAVTAYYDNSAKLATTSTGIDVTGTVTADGLTVDKANGSLITLNATNAGTPSNHITYSDTDGDTAYIGFISNSTDNLTVYNATATGDIELRTNALQRLNIDGATGDISFYEDTGTTAKLFWDASAESLGIGTSSPSVALEVDGTIKASGNGKLQIADDTEGSTFAFNVGGGGALEIYDGATERMRIDSSGNLLVGTTDTFPGDGDTNTGIALTATGSAAFSRDGFRVVSVNRNTSDGTLIEFNKGGVEVGSIGTHLSRIHMSAGDAGLFLDGGGTPAIWPWKSTAITSGDADAEITLGDSSNRFKDLYLSGNINLSASSQINSSTAFYLDSDIIHFRLNNEAESARIDSSGNLLVGTTNSLPGVGNTVAGISLYNDGRIFASKSANTTMSLNRSTSDGAIAEFRKDGSTVGSIGTKDADLYIGTDDTTLRFVDGSDKIYPANASGNARDDAIDLGNTNARFQDIYATNGTIQTSDRNEKQDIEALSEAEQRVAVACKGLLRKFRWKSSVADKGDDARIHFGIIAQDLQAAFEAEGLDAGRYGMFINSTWTDEETGEERTRMGVRYSELLAFIIAAI